MLRHVVDANGLKSSITDVQRDLDERRDARDFREYLGREMQARGGRSDCAALFRVNSLIALAIGSGNSGRSLDVRRQRCRSDLGQRFVKRTFTMKANATKFRARFVQHFRCQPAGAKDGARTFLQSCARADEGFPNLGFEFAHEKDLDFAARRFATSDQARGNHARVVYDHDIVRSKLISELMKIRISPLLPGTIEYEHPRSVTLCERRLRDELGRKLVIKL